jgi:hypothetical protein
MKMEATFSTKTSVYFQRAIRHCIPHAETQSSYSIILFFPIQVVRSNCQQRACRHINDPRTVPQSIFRCRDVACLGLKYVPSGENYTKITKELHRVEVIILFNYKCTQSSYVSLQSRMWHKRIHELTFLAEPAPQRNFQLIVFWTQWWISLLIRYFTKLARKQMLKEN